jgi:hypothetical protein
MAMLPYVTATGNVDKALLGIKSAATPAKVTQDFVKTILKIPGGSGDQMTSLLKKIGFVNADGSPSDIYRRFRNSSSTGPAAAEALRYGYAPLFKRNEFWPALDDADIRGLIIEETGLPKESPTVTTIMNTLKGIKKFATFSSEGEKPPKPETEAPQQLPQTTFVPTPSSQSFGLNVGYTINLNLPATSDIAVFNAIFKSLKDNLLKDTDGQ